MVARKASALGVPANAIREAGERFRARPPMARTARRRNARQSRCAFALQRAEILDGLKAGDVVVLDDRIRAGQRVRGVAPVALPRTRKRRFADVAMRVEAATDHAL